jgi:hypothetical protein
MVASVKKIPAPPYWPDFSPSLFRDRIVGWSMAHEKATEE